MDKRALRRQPTTLLQPGSAVSDSAGCRLHPAKRFTRLGALVATTAVSVGLLVGLPAAAQAQAYQRGRSQPTIVFKTLDNRADATFNQLLGINNRGVIAGYFGSGTPATIHPNKGYTLRLPYTERSYTNENFPGSQQTQVVGINNRGQTVGFWVDGNGANMGFVSSGGSFRSVTDPMTTSSPSFNQLLGVNDAGLAVGFYNDAAGNSHAYLYNTRTRHFSPIVPPGAVSSQATGINGRGDVTGFMTDSGGQMRSWRLGGHSFQTIAVPAATATQAFGINNNDQVVGQFVDAAGKTHGFLLSRATFRTIDDPNGVGSTTINGINDQGAFVGFYTDAAGNTDGMLGLVQMRDR